MGAKAGGELGQEAWEIGHTSYHQLQDGKKARGLLMSKANPICSGRNMQSMA